jgi:hypothetical protein
MFTTITLTAIPETISKGKTSDKAQVENHFARSARNLIRKGDNTFFEKGQN